MYQLGLVRMKKRIIGIFICVLLIAPILSYAVVSSTDNWSMFHHDQLHTGYSSSAAPTTNNVLWSFSTNDDVYSSPTIIDGKLYIGSDDQKIYCLDAEDGHELWNSSVGGEVWESSPAVANDMVFIGGGNTFYCFNAENGSTIWSYQTGGSIRSSPVVVNDRVYVGSWDRKVYCFDADTSDGEDEGYDDLLEPPIVNYDLIWIFETGNLVDCSPAVYDNKVFIGSNDKKIYCLNAINGSEIWNFATGGNVFSSPAIANDKVYVGSYDHKLYCIDVTTGLENWSFTTGDRVASSPAIHDGKVYVGSNDGNVYCLDALTGESSWDSPLETGGNVFSSPAIADNKVYIGSGDNKIYCLYANNGTEIWNYATGASVDSSPAVYDGKVYIGSLDNTVYCFGEVLDTNQPPAQPAQPIGPTEGEVGIEYTFATTTTDPDGDQIYYWFDWGDNINSGWISTSTANHTWTEEGDYEMKVKAKDIHEAESSWSDPLTIHIVTNISEEPGEQQYGWIFGIVSDTEPLEGVSVCVILSNGVSSKCKITDENGRYAISISPGTYTIEASKEGYETSTKYSIEVKNRQAIEVNFILQEIPDYEPEISQDVSEQFIEAKITAEIMNNKVGGKIEVADVADDYNIITYNDELNIEIEPVTRSGKIVTFKVGADESTPSQVIVVLIKDLLDEISVEFDGEQISETSDLYTFFSPDNQDTEYIMVSTANSSYVLIHISNFSEHTITISSVLEGLYGITAAVLYFAFFALAGTLFTITVFVVLYTFIHSKKRK